MIETQVEKKKRNGGGSIGKSVILMNIVLMMQIMNN